MLNGWKEITGYAGRSRGTLLKMVEEDLFPIRILRGKPTITEDSINEWFKNPPIPSAYSGMDSSEITERMSL